MLLGGLRVAIRAFGRADPTSSQTHRSQTLQVYSLRKEFLEIRSPGIAHEATSVKSKKNCFKKKQKKQRRLTTCGREKKSAVTVSFLNLSVSNYVLFKTVKVIILWTSLFFFLKSKLSIKKKVLILFRLNDLAKKRNHFGNSAANLKSHLATLYPWKTKKSLQQLKRKEQNT